MNRGEYQAAVRKALSILDEWNEITGLFGDGSSYRWEIEAIIRNAVDILVYSGR